MRQALPFAAGDLLDGVAFGVIAVGAGLGAAQAIAMSATAFSGTAQFAALSVDGSGGSLLGVLAAAVALNARYLVYAAGVAPALSRNRVARVAQAQLLTDMSWALALRTGRASRAILLGVGAVSFATWTIGTAIGALAGGTLGDGYQAIGLDATIPAFFVCVLLERSLDRRDAAYAAAGAVAAIALMPVLPAGLPLVAALGIGLLRGKP